MIRESRFSKLNIRLIEAIQSVMTSLFKGLIFYIKSDNRNGDDLRYL